VRYSTCANDKTVRAALFRALQITHRPLQPESRDEKIKGGVISIG
jgi:hypothetical protein